MRACMWTQIPSVREPDEHTQHNLIRALETITDKFGPKPPKPTRRRSLSTRTHPRRGRALLTSPRRPLTPNARNPVRDPDAPAWARARLPPRGRLRPRADLFRRETLSPRSSHTSTPTPHASPRPQTTPFRHAFAPCATDSEDDRYIPSPLLTHNHPPRHAAVLTGRRTYLTMMSSMLTTPKLSANAQAYDAETFRTRSRDRPRTRSRPASRRKPTRLPPNLLDSGIFVIFYLPLCKFSLTYLPPES